MSHQPLATTFATISKDLFDDIDAVFIALRSTLNVRNRLQDIEAIHSWNLPTFLLGDFPEMSFGIHFFMNMYLGNTTGL